MCIEFGRDICGDRHNSTTREWLVTNGIGGYASGTISGILTRRYHGLLVAALQPPLGRTLLVSKFAETVQYDQQLYSLDTNRWSDGTVEPEGYRQIESFKLEGTVPVWDYAIANARLEKRVWMQQGANTTYVQYNLSRATQPLTLTIKALVNYRDYHSDTQVSDIDEQRWQMQIDPVSQGVRVVADANAKPFYLLSNASITQSSIVHNWYHDFDLAVERYRGLRDREDHLHAATFEVTLNPGDSVTLVASSETAPELDGAIALSDRHAHEQTLLKLWENTSSHQTGSDTSRATPTWIKQLVLAADQFIVDRPLSNQRSDQPTGKTIIAGYHWFGDWGRDTMISLPGLTLATGRSDVARSILQTFAKYVDQGMLPNRFPDAGETPDYNTVDATLWYFEAIRQYYSATADTQLLAELFPVLAEIIDRHCRGTRFHIQLDASDGLLYAGEAGVQLTWMDAKVGDWVVTPRIGKPIEINALWYNALRTMATFARQLGKSAHEYEAIADRTLANFQRFWNPTTGYCYDVLDTPTGNDPALRPNQIFAVSLPESPLTSLQQKAIVDTCGLHLLTSHGLRSLSPDHPQYQGTYGGDQLQRDGAYHQGTTWGWLIGAFVLAHLRVYNHPVQALEYLEAMGRQLRSHGVGSLSEIFDGDAPMTPRGCIAQAWTVAEVLRVWRALYIK